MKRLFKILLGVILSINLIFYLGSCAQNNLTQGNNSNSIQSSYFPMPEEPDWDAIQSALSDLELGLNDALNQIESTHIYRITYNMNLEYNNSVGDEWDCGISYNDEYIKSGSQIIIPTSVQDIKLVAFANELDEWTDFASTCVTFDFLEAGEKETGWATVVVIENNGKYTGNIAKWYFEIAIERI